jgi:hypothetical protein
MVMPKSIVDTHSTNSLARLQIMPQPFIMHVFMANHVVDTHSTISPPHSRNTTQTSTMN